MNIQPNRSLRTIVILLVIAGILALALGGYLAPLSRTVVTPLVSVQSWASTRYAAIRDFITAPRDLAALRQENADLAAENARLQAQVIELPSGRRQSSPVQVIAGGRTRPGEAHRADEAEVGADFSRGKTVGTGISHAVGVRVALARIEQ